LQIALLPVLLRNLVVLLYKRNVCLPFLFIPIRQIVPEADKLVVPWNHIVEGCNTSSSALLLISSARCTGTIGLRVLISAVLAGSCEIKSATRAKFMFWPSIAEDVVIPTKRPSVSKRPPPLDPFEMGAFVCIKGNAP